jgi:hypothetical protein
MGAAAATKFGFQKTLYGTKINESLIWEREP